VGTVAAGSGELYIICTFEFIHLAKQLESLRMQNPNIRWCRSCIGVSRVTSGALEVGDAFSGSLTRSAGEEAYDITVGTVAAGAKIIRYHLCNFEFIHHSLITITADAKSQNIR
jgi:hypothetical protein